MDRIEWCPYKFHDPGFPSTMLHCSDRICEYNLSIITGKFALPDWENIILQKMNLPFFCIKIGCDISPACNIHNTFYSTFRADLIAAFYTCLASVPFSAWLHSPSTLMTDYFYLRVMDYGAKFKNIPKIKTVLFCTKIRALHSWNIYCVLYILIPTLCSDLGNMSSHVICLQSSLFSFIYPQDGDWQHW